MYCCPIFESREDKMDMSVILGELLKIVRNEKLYVSPSYPPNKEEVINFMAHTMDPDTLTMNNLTEYVHNKFGDLNSYVFLRKLLEDNKNLLDQDDFDILNRAVQQLDQTVSNYLKYPAAVLYYKILHGDTLVDTSVRSGVTSRSNRGSKPNGFLKDMRKPQTSFSGTDMVCSITVPGKGPIVFGELAQLSYSIFREKVPVRALGRVSMKGYTRGMRTITGILSFTVFDQSIVYQCMQEIKDQGYRMLMDEMPLFDITVSMANEFGQQSLLTLYGVSTYTEGQSMGVNDMMIQNVYEFYALDIDPLSRLEVPKKNSSTISTSTNNYSNLSSNDVYWGHPLS